MEYGRKLTRIIWCVSHPVEDGSTEGVLPVLLRHQVTPALYHLRDIWIMDGLHLNLLPPILGKPGRFHLPGSGCLRTAGTESWEKCFLQIYNVCWLYATSTKLYFAFSPPRWLAPQWSGAPPSGPQCGCRYIPMPTIYKNRRLSGRSWDHQLDYWGCDGNQMTWDLIDLILWRAWRNDWLFFHLLQKILSLAQANW